MRSILLLAAAMTNPAHAQAAPSLSVVAATPALYDRAPWWMREPVIASLGEVRTELAPNRAVLGAGYEVVDRSAAEATKAAAAKVRALAAALSAYGPEAVRITTSFSTRPLYAQYRDKDGKILENERADKVDRYAVTANVGVELRDLRLTERAYATLLAAKPTSTSTPYFRLQPSNATNTELFRLAVADAARRAKEAAEEAGGASGRREADRPDRPRLLHRRARCWRSAHLRRRQHRRVGGGCDRRAAWRTIARHGPTPAPAPARRIAGRGLAAPPPAPSAGTHARSLRRLRAGGRGVGATARG